MTASSAATGPQTRWFTTESKYQVVAGWLRACSGSLLDIGARDRVLGRLLTTAPGLAYASADLGGGHDFALDLEQPLPLPDHSFDYVVALDVLEHVEHIHQAFHELARLARRSVLLSLPNLAAWPRRWSFFWRGHLNTGKYDLLPEHQGDRHRWLTVYPEMNRFVAENARRAGLHWQALVEELEYPRGWGWLVRPAATRGLVSGGAFTSRCLYQLRRV